MQSGVINADNLAQVLSNIAKRRQSGELELKIGEEKACIFFKQGKIIDFRPEQTISQEDVRAALLKRSKSLDLSYREVLQGAIVHYLYTLSLTSGGIYTFRVRTVPVDGELVSAISVSELLIELATVKSGGLNEELAGSLFEDIEKEGNKEGVEEGGAESGAEQQEVEQESEPSAQLSMVEVEQERKGGMLGGGLSRWGVVNAALLQSRVVVNLVGITFLLSAVLVPAFFWGDLWG